MDREITGIPVYSEPQIEGTEEIEFGKARLRYCFGEIPPVWELSIPTEEYGDLYVILTDEIGYEMNRIVNGHPKAFCCAECE